MECRKFELTIISANGLEDVRKFHRMKVYAKITIGGKPETERRSPVDKHGGTDPAWNFNIQYTIAESVVEHHGVMLVIKLYCKRKLGDRYIGEVYASMKELFDHAYNCGGSALVSYPVKKGSVNSQGGLKFSYRFGKCVDVEKLVLAEGFVDWNRSSSF